jgi:cytoskeleton protein RodZ
MAGIGETLREARERANLDINDFEVRTKIRAKYLRALEDEEWSLLPGYTFTKGFLRTYADMLGLDGRALVDEFKRQYRDPSELEAPPLSPGTRRDTRARGRDRPRESAGERGGRAGRPSRPAARPPIVVGVIVLVVLIVAALYAVGVLLPRHPKQKTSTTNSQTTTHSRTTHTKTTRTVHHTHKPTRVALRLRPSAAVYVCLVGFPDNTNRHPHVRINGLTLSPGGHEPTYHDNHFFVTFGNSSMTMVVDGRRQVVAPSPNPTSLRISLFGRVRPLPASKVPHCG